MPTHKVYADWMVPGMIRQAGIGVQRTFGGCGPGPMSGPAGSPGGRQSPIAAQRKPIMMKKPLNMKIRASPP